MYFPDIPKLQDWKNFTGRGPMAAVPKGAPTPLAPEVTKLDELIGRYHQVMPMARINALNDMTPLISSWIAKTPKPVIKSFAPAPTASLYDAMMALKETVARKLKAVIPNNALYDKVVCLGYSIQTGTTRDYWDPTGKAWKTTANGYMGNSDPKVDLTARCNQMIAAIQVAHTLNQQKMVGPKKVADDGKTLKIFMAPEFFFRGQSGAFTMDYLMGNKGKNGAPDEDSILDALRKETGQAKYASWLFVFGTFISGTERNRYSCQTCLKWLANEMVPALGRKMLTCPDCKKQARCVNPSCLNDARTKGALRVNPADNIGPRDLSCPLCNKVYKFCEHVVGVTIDNYALVQKGGHAGGDGIHDYCTQKAYVSNLDFDEVDNKAPRIKIFGREEEFIQPIEDPGSAHERMGGSVFNMDGITYGIEVCLDHLEGRLAADPNRGRIQIQLIPSAGAHIEAGSVGCVLDGILFNVDGGGGAKVSVSLNAAGGLKTQTNQGDLPVNTLTTGLFPPSSPKVEIFGPFNMPPA